MAYVTLSAPPSGTATDVSAVKAGDSQCQRRTGTDDTARWYRASFE
ncbi:hypothetical protein [Xanthomonas rydalmerensis]|uniref:Uncharacterized protein n=1 Tax=Xanthomonas rydalmerensis TaxID=3046274 RepID=A0ABZ0JPE3_9XANT|nr:hypothetical protein [Xanthomonas sp. DM-2023]WOS41281.1 hypothetical protein QN243_02005 [Xanthomonas sp. DM-2023]WOS45466.1 hypothetical protein QN242_02005 [Xanthomonas sp. DM-2023]WOS49645.1 hypothetical protein QN240_02005 [Xanthomonas sp. DM-2023]WOS53825.1 hypothetical protein QN244_02005 [Xanthomonas sp. DM-2023]WOS58008.1 hypothetical protein QN245_02005 [Xanthomonas sp. DM-2023]